MHLHITLSFQHLIVFNMVVDQSNAFMNGMAKDGFLNLFLGNYGVGIGENEVGSELGLEVCPTIIIETKFNENDSRILTIKIQAQQE